MTQVFLITNSILKRAFEDEQEISPMKLQKLLYFVYKRYLQETGLSLFEEDFEVWQYGPVVPSVYHKFSSYGSGNINDYIYSSSDKKDGIFQTISNKSQKFHEALNYVWDRYGGYEAIRLSELTHETDTAWDKALNAKHRYLFDSDIKLEEWLT